MIKRFRKWLYDNFLPAWAKETLLEENKALVKECDELRRKLDEREAYISGLESGMRAQRRIIIKTGEAKQ